MLLAKDVRYQHGTMIEHLLFFALPSLSRSYVLLSLTDRGGFATDSASKFSRWLPSNRFISPGHHVTANSQIARSRACCEIPWRYDLA